MISEESCIYKQCDGSGLIWIKDHQENIEFMKECPCKAVKLLEKKLLGARLPEEFKDVTLNSFEVDVYEKDISKERAANAKRIAKNYILKFEQMQEQGKGLYFYSHEKGSGKTRLAASIMKAITKMYDKSESPLRIIYSSTADLIGEIKKTFEEGSKIKTSDIIEAAKTADLAIFDDIGVENVKGWIEETFTRILEFRLQNKKPTIFTSNLGIDELDKKYPDGRISSRVEKLAFPVRMPDEKIRSKIAKQENEQLLQTLFE
ncbi:ATP-binding protein [Bacillus sp. WMMC1349]|uniref:ATP-binding protein n=1 Tax=Bacillus sp. WMMC1349 TaxID=2736254 RepID=UPI00155526DE|nr:DnaA/Hda family protein [Bacillus sp. WMMC1349]NPC91195.1 ATP-binding protein [Bacillus sp. WMMC1349]